MFDFLDQFLSTDVVSIIFYILIGLYIIKSIIEFFATRNISKLKKSILEVQQMVSKFRLPNYQDTDPAAQSANRQTFTPYTDKYVYNEDTGELNLAVNKEGEILQINDQDKIDSFASSALDKVLERFLPQDYASVIAPLSDNQMSDVVDPVRDLHDYSKILDHAETLREKYGLDADMSCIDVFNFVDNLNTRYKDKIDGYTKAKQSAQPAPAQPAPAQFDYDQLAAAILKQQNGGV